LRREERKREKIMEYAPFALPIRMGKSDAARAFLHELEGER